jgi:MPBQ/MSBQ methyltransferase
MTATTAVTWPAAETASPAGDLIEYYTEVGPDFAAWSLGFNIHFGFYRGGLSPFGREAMLEQMNREVQVRLERPTPDTGHLLDLGCGVGATARTIARLAPAALVTGVTVVPWQVAEARRLTASAGLGGRVRFVEADYRSLPWPDESFDAAYAIESSCHASGADKADFLAEAARVLKPVGRLVVADAFLRHGRPLNPLLRRSYETMCRWWRLEACGEIGPFRRRAESLGFEDVRVEDISWRIAPSVLFIPLVVARFLWHELVVRRSRLTRRRWENALAPVLGMVVGAARSAFGYYLVSARKR